MVSSPEQRVSGQDVEKAKERAAAEKSKAEKKESTRVLFYVAPVVAVLIAMGVTLPLHETAKAMNAEAASRAARVLFAGREVAEISSWIWLAGFTAMFFGLRIIVFAALKDFSLAVVPHPPGLSTGDEKIIAEKKPFLAKKFTKYVWHGSMYVVMFCWGLWILNRSMWGVFWPGRPNCETCAMFPDKTRWDSLADDWPHKEDFKVQPDIMFEIQFFMLVQTSWYLNGLLENLIHDRSRDDFYVMLAHHFVAISLIYGAFVSDSHRVGMHVMVSLDVCDIMMYWAKTGHLQTSHPITGACLPGYYWYQWRRMVAIGISWLIFRCAIFYMEIHTMVFASNVNGNLIGEVLRILLFVMLTLQLVWAVLVWKIVITLLTKGFIDDIISGDIRNSGTPNEKEPTSGDEKDTKKTK